MTALPRRAAATLALSAALAGCAVGPDYQSPPPQVPPAYDDALAAAGPAAKVEFGQWWRTLKDPELNRLVDSAVAGNLDVEIALDRLQEARTAEAIVVDAALPSVSASGAAVGGSGNTPVRGAIDSPLSAATTTTGYHQVNEAGGFDAVWQLDLFGKIRREMEASRADAEAAAENRNAVIVAVVADVARAYIDLRGLQARLAIVRDEIVNAQRSYNFVQIRYEHGLANELDPTLAQRELSTLKAQIPPLEAGVVAAENTIAVLTGRFPGSLRADLAAVGKIPPIPGRIDPGLPLDLLRRRPDIRAAERQLAAATARVGVATADLYPHLSLTGAVGVQAQDFSGGAPLVGHIWSGGPGAYWSLLDFGTLDGLVQIADFQTREQLTRYKRSVLQAVREVDTGMAAYDAEQQRLEDLSKALHDSAAALNLVEERFERGLTDYLNVIDAERENYALQDQFAIAQAAVADRFVGLYLALGGGWEDHQAVPPIRQPLPTVVAAAERLFTHPEPEAAP